MRIFIDANILFSAALRPTGNARAIFDLAGAARVTLWTSELAIDEASRNLRLKSPESLEELIDLLSRVQRTGAPSSRAVAAAAESGLESKDVPILGGAVAARADILVTGDRRHFGRFFGTTAAGAKILPPADLVSLLLGRIEKNRP